MDRTETFRESLSGQFDRLSRRLAGDLGSGKPFPSNFGPSLDPIQEPMLLSPVDSDASNFAGSDQMADSVTFAIESVKFFERPDTVQACQRTYSRAQSRRRHSSVELLGAMETGGLDAEVLAHYDRATTGSTEAKVLTVCGKTPQRMDYYDSNKFHTQQDIVLDKYMVSSCADQCQ